MAMISSYLLLSPITNALSSLIILLPSSSKKRDGYHIFKNLKIIASKHFKNIKKLILANRLSVFATSFATKTKYLPDKLLALGLMENAQQRTSQAMGALAKTQTAFNRVKEQANTFIKKWMSTIKLQPKAKK
jgi:hypothetical protein